MTRFLLIDVWGKCWAATTSIEAMDAAIRLLNPPGAFIWCGMLQLAPPRKNVIIENLRGDI